MDETQESESLDHLVALHYQFEEVLAVNQEEEKLRQELNELIDEEVDIRMRSMISETPQGAENDSNVLDNLIDEEIDKIFNLNLQYSEHEQNKRFDDINELEEESIIDKESNSEEWPIEGLTDRLIKITFDHTKSRIDSDKDETSFKCSLCLEDQSFEESETFGCCHIFCKNCLSSFFASKVNEGNVVDIKCPEEGCNMRAEDPLIRSVLPKEKIARYESFVVKKITDNLEDVMNCAQCNEPVECDLAAGFGFCSKCNFAFCTSCHKSYHGTDNCSDIARRFEESEKSEQLIRQNFKKCPGCQTNIEKDEIGCNHMTCAKCSAQFCWLCLSQLTDNQFDIERHYSRCVLFSHEFVD